MATRKDRDWPRLAALVRDRRTDLGMTQEDVRAAGGPGTATMRLIESGLQEKDHHPAILARLEDALRWRRGSVAAVLAGGDPVPLEDAPGGAPPAAGPVPRPVPGPDQQVRAALYAALAAVNAPLREAVLAEARAGIPFTDPLERLIWETAEWGPELRAEEIANLRARRASRAG